MAVIFHMFPGLPAEWVLGMEPNELLDWYEKALDLDAKKQVALVTLIFEGKYETPFKVED